MTLWEIIILLVFIAAIWFWLDSIHAKDIASRAGKKGCADEGVSFLDETVEITHLSVKRDSRGILHFYREYRFEFSSDGSQRYRGDMSLFGKRPGRVTLEPHRVPVDYHQSKLPTDIF